MSSYFPEHKHSEPGVKARIVATDAEHIYFDANHHGGMGKDFPTACYMEIRGITYGASGHFHKWADGTWNPGLEKDSVGTRLYHHLYMSRGNSNNASDPARRKALEIMTRIVRQWVIDNPQALIAAQGLALQEKRKKVLDRIAELRSQIDKAAAEMIELDRQLQGNQ